MDEERDLVEFQDDEGNSLTMEVKDYFFYEGKEYALLQDVEASETCEACDSEGCEGCGNATETFIMRVDAVSEEEEAFVPVDDEVLFGKLVDFVQNELYAEDDDEDFFDDEEAFEDAKDE